MPSHFEPSRWLGTRWRVRVVFVLAFAVLATLSLNTLLAWKTKRIVPAGAGPPIVTSVVIWRDHQFEAWDWRTDQSWIVARSPLHPNGAVVVNDKTVAWVYGGFIHAANVASPHARRSWKMPPQPKPQEVDRRVFVGMSADERFVIFQTRLLHIPRTSDDFAVEVYDLSTGERTEIVAGYLRTRATSSENVFVADFIAPGLPIRAAPQVKDTLRLTPEGKLISLGRSVPKFNILDSLSIAPTETDQFEISGDPNAIGISVSATSPLGDVFLATSGSRSTCYLGNATTIHWLPINVVPTRYHDPSPISVDGAFAAIHDQYDDLHVVDVNSGQIVASNHEGSQQISTGRYLLAVALAFTLAWYVLLCFETAWIGSFIDATAILLLVGLSSLTLQGLFWLDPHIPYLSWLAYWSYDILRLLGPIALIVAAGVAVGWYWAFGTGTMPGRWVRGLLWLLVMATPSVMSFSLGSSWYFLSMLGDWPLGAAIGVVVAGVMSVVVSSVRLLGWTIANGPMVAQHHQFGLGRMMAMIAGIAFVMGCARVTVLNCYTGQVEVLCQSWMYFLGPMTLAMLLPAIWLSNYSRWVRISLVAAIVIANLAWSVLQIFIPPPAFAAHNIIPVKLTLELVLLLVLGLLCHIARRAGWRWVKIGIDQAVVASAQRSAA